MYRKFSFSMQITKWIAQLLLCVTYRRQEWIHILQWPQQLELCMVLFMVVQTRYAWLLCEFVRGNRMYVCLRLDFWMWNPLFSFFFFVFLFFRSCLILCIFSQGCFANVGGDWKHWKYPQVSRWCQEQEATIDGFWVRMYNRVRMCWLFSKHLRSAWEMSLWNILNDIKPSLEWYCSVGV